MLFSLASSFLAVSIFQLDITHTTNNKTGEVN